MLLVSIAVTTSHSAPGSSDKVLTIYGTSAQQKASSSKDATTSDVLVSTEAAIKGEPQGI